MFDYNSYPACGATASARRDTVRIYWDCPSRWSTDPNFSKPRQSSTTTSPSTVSSTRIPTATTPRAQVDNEGKETGGLGQTELILLITFLVLLVVLIVIVVVLIIRYYKLQKIKLEITQDARTIL